jgi:CheY-like chemotaxis protein
MEKEGVRSKARRKTRRARCEISPSSGGNVRWEAIMARVLIVDDSVIGRGLICNMLKYGRHESVEVPNGDAALAALESLEIDCVILDLLMPGKGGLEVLREIRDRGIATPIICTVACEAESTKAACRKLGAEGWLEKPIDQKELLEEVTRVLAPARAHVKD